MSITVLSEVTVYEFDGVEPRAGEGYQSIPVRSHWNRNEMAVLEIGGRRYTVSIKDLTTALENAHNNNRHA